MGEGVLGEVMLVQLALHIRPAVSVSGELIP